MSRVTVCDDWHVNTTITAGEDTCWQPESSIPRHVEAGQRPLSGVIVSPEKCVGIWSGTRKLAFALDRAEARSGSSLRTTSHPGQTKAV